MLDFVLSKMTWLIASILVMSFVIGFYQIQTDTIDDNMLENATQEVNRVIKRLEGVNGEMCVNFTFDRYYSYRAFYLPGKIGGEIYKFTFYESYMRATSGDYDIALHFGTNIQPLQMSNQTTGESYTNVVLEDLLEAPEHSYVNKLTLYSNQDFGVASQYVEGIGYKVFVYMFTDTVFYSMDDDEGKHLLYGDSEAPSLSNLSDEPDYKTINNPVNITLDVEGEQITRVFYAIEDPEGGKQTITMTKGPNLQYYHEVNCIIPGEYSYTIWAIDVFGRANSTDEHLFTALDPTPPVLSNMQIEKNPQESGNDVIFYVAASDDYEVTGVYINITAPNGNTQYHEMTHVSGDKWTFSTELIPIGTYSYVFSAKDSSDNWGTSTSSTFVIQDTTAPVVSVTTSPNFKTVNETVYFNATITDIVGVKSVTHIVSGNTTPMVHISGNLWSGEITFTSAGPRVYKITATDTSDNLSENIGQISINV